MIFKDYNPQVDSSNALHKVLADRGITNLSHFIHTTDADINSPELLDNIAAAAQRIQKAIKYNEKMLVVVDCDCDGYTSSALFINFFNKLYPYYTIDFVMHEQKQHGLKDIDPELIKQYNIIICPDGASGDYAEHKWCYDNDISVVILDHHAVDLVSEYAIVINNQLCDYPNKEFSGVGIVWQFCRYYISKYEIDNIDLPNQYLDLVALGLILLG